MKKQLLSLSVASAIALAGAMPAYAEDDDCEGVEVQTRFALVNCLVESAVAIAAAAASDNDNNCAVGEWDIDAIVPEWWLAKIPIQGLAFVSNGVDSYELNGSSSAMLKNSVNCSISTAASDNTFDGKELIYSTGSGNFYVDAVVDKDSPTVCITESVSSGNIDLARDDFDEENHLSFEGEEDEISANGLLTIYASGKGNNPNKPAVAISAWTVEEQVTIPELGTIMEDAFQLEATTGDIGDCQIKIDASVQNLEFFEVEGESGGLTISGTMSVGPDDDDD